MTKEGKGDEVFRVYETLQTPENEVLQRNIKWLQIL